MDIVSLPFLRFQCTLLLTCRPLLVIIVLSIFATLCKQCLTDARATIWRLEAVLYKSICLYIFSDELYFI